MRALRALVKPSAPTSRRAIWPYFRVREGAGDRSHTSRPIDATPAAVDAREQRRDGVKREGF